MASSTEDAFNFLPLGGIIQEFRIGGTNIVLNLPTEESYRKNAHPFFGETIGRLANRISGAKINSLNGGKSYNLAANNGPNALHGGVKGWGKQTFEGPTPMERNGKESVLYKYVSKDGEEGYPGSVELRLWYSAGKEVDEGVEKTGVEIEYEVELIGDEVEETAVGVTNHSYFNITGGPTIEGTLATLYTNLHQVVDAQDIPTGAIEPFPGITAGKEFELGPVEPHVDHCMIMNPDPSSIPIDTRKEKLAKLCSFYHPGTKIHFEALSTEPAFQYYTGKHVNVAAVDGMPARGSRAGMCIEPSRYVDAINHEEWKGMVVLKKGQLWGSKIVYRGWKD